jgi:hypothetical protein
LFILFQAIDRVKRTDATKITGARVGAPLQNALRRPYFLKHSFISVAAIIAHFSPAALRRQRPAAKPAVRLKKPHY